jgi:O-antigen/teichoic acid export membrane protein
VSREDAPAAPAPAAPSRSPASARGAQASEGEPGKFRRDVAWNFASLAVLGVSGIALQALIGRHYGAATLGVFNQVLAAYILVSQAAAGGINLSALRAIAEDASDRARISSIVAGATLPVLALAALFALVFYASRDAVADVLESPDVALGIAAATPGLFFFALNKLLLGVVNGVQRMRAYAVYQAARYLLILAGLGIAFLRSVPGPRLAFVFSFAEILLFLALVVEVAFLVSWPRTRDWVAWSWRHLAYGMKSAVSGMLLELNSRIDVLMIGYFLSDALVGIYSFASMLAEGLFQLLVVLQTNYNPLLARGLAERALERLAQTVRRGRNWTYAGMAGVGVVAVAVYPIAVRLLAGEGEFAESRIPFALLMGGIVAISGYYPFHQTLLMADLPAWHTLLMSGTVGCNVLFNALLIPRLGIAGAALATGLALAASVVLLKLLVRRLVGLRL